jgi:uncharacterized membrane protein (DUF4010 family)
MLGGFVGSLENLWKSWWAASFIFLMFLAAVYYSQQIVKRKTRRAAIEAAIALLFAWGFGVSVLTFQDVVPVQQAVFLGSVLACIYGGSVFARYQSEKGGPNHAG